MGSMVALRDGFVCVEIVHPPFARGYEWPRLGSAVAPEPLDNVGLVGREAFSPEYWNAAAVGSAALLLYVRQEDAHVAPSAMVPPEGFEWLGYDLGERVWAVPGGYSVVDCEVLRHPGLSGLLPMINRFGLFEARDAVLEAHAIRAELLTSGDANLEPHFEPGGPFIHRVAVLATQRVSILAGKD